MAITLALEVSLMKREDARPKILPGLQSRLEALRNKADARCANNNIRKVSKTRVENDFSSQIE